MGGVESTADAAVAPPTGRPAAPSGVSPGAVAAGALTGFVAVVLIATARAVLAHAVPRLDDSAWIGVLYLLVLGAAGAAGWVARRRSAAGTTVLVGAAAAGIALVAWIPVRVLIWIARDEQRGLFSGTDPALRVGPLLVNAVVAVLVGTFGAWLAARVTDGTRETDAAG